MKPISELIKKVNNNQFPKEKTIIITEEESLSLETINLKSEWLALKLLRNGVKSGDLIPFLIDHSPDFFISVLAAWSIGAIPVPINIRLLPTEITEQLKFLQCEYALCDKPLDEKIHIKNVQKINTESEKEKDKSVNISFNFNQDKTAIIIFTSGSSNTPKAVELTFYNLMQSALIGNSKLNQTSEDRWLASLPFYHIGGFSIIFRALMFGTSIIIPQNLKIESIIESILKFKPTLISLVSSQMQILLNKNIQPNSELRNVLLGGGFIDSTLMSEAISKGWKVSKVYGSTETSSFVSYLSSEEFIAKPKSAGKAILPNEIFLMNENRNELDENSEGEIVIKSPSVMKGYYKDEKSTKAKLKNGLYFSGDYGYKDSEGYLHVINRRIDLIVSGGENINPLEVENAILQFHKVHEVCIIGIIDPKWGQKVGAAIVKKSDMNFSIDELKDFLKGKIASFKIPKEILFLPELPKTELGKVRRDLLKKMFAS